VVEQIIRPTGLIDPECIIRPTAEQVDDLLAECRKVTQQGSRVLVTTLTKRMAEDLTEYMQEAGLRVRYLHSDIDTLERIDIIHGLRHGEFDILVGINLLREGLDIPECALVAILDADKEGFLRSHRSLIQTIGRAARNVEGRVILYADRITDSMKKALEETERRREIQVAHNQKHGITPKQVIKKIAERMREEEDTTPKTPKLKGEKDLRRYMEDLRRRMLKAAENLEFEKAAEMRDELNHLEHTELGVPDQKRA